MAAATAGAIGLEPLLGSSHSLARAGNDHPESKGDEHAEEDAEIRIAAAKAERSVSIPPHTTNGDEERYADKCGTYTKALLQDGPGRVNLNAYDSFRDALHSGNPADFENIIMGGARKLTDPQAGLAFDLEGTDSRQFGNSPCPRNQETMVVVPPAPALASSAYGTELIEMYWGSLLRDVPFTEYPRNPVAAQAAHELSQLHEYAGPGAMDKSPRTCCSAKTPAGADRGHTSPSFSSRRQSSANSPLASSRSPISKTLTISPTPLLGRSFRMAAALVYRTRSISNCASGIVGETSPHIPTSTCSIKRTS